MVGIYEIAVGSLEEVSQNVGIFAPSVREILPFDFVDEPSVDSARQPLKRADEEHSRNGIETQSDGLGKFGKEPQSYAAVFFRQTGVFFRKEYVQSGEIIGIRVKFGFREFIAGRIVIPNRSETDFRTLLLTERNSNVHPQRDFLFDMDTAERHGIIAAPCHDERHGNDDFMLGEKIPVFRIEPFSKVFRIHNFGRVTECGVF